MAQTAVVRRVLPTLVDELRCKSLLDIPCGDYYWMRSLDVDIDYTGADIVPALIDRNAQQFGGDRRKFLRLDIVHDSLPTADLVLCRDCMVHLSFADIFRALEKIRASGSRYLLATTFVEHHRNDDIPTGYWRPINLQTAPFNFPTPMRIIDEECPTHGCRDKCLGLWRIDDIPGYGNAGRR